MPWLETAFPVRMCRIALVAPAGALRAMLVAVAAAGCVEIDADTGPDAGGHGHHAAAGAAAAGAAGSGETQLHQYAGAAVRGHGAAALAGWTPGCPGHSARRAPCPAWLRGRAAAVAEGRGRADSGGWFGRAAGADSAGLDLRDRSVCRRQPGLAGLGQLRADVRRDVRRCRGRPAAGRRGRRAALGLAGQVPPVQGGVAVRRRGRSLRHRVRPALRRVLRSHRGRARALARAARASGAAAGRWHWPRRRAAGRRLRARHAEPVARGRLAAGAVRAVRNRRNGALRRHRRARGRLVRAGRRAGRNRRRPRGWPRSGWRSPASWPRPAAAELASRRPA